LQSLWEYHNGIVHGTTIELTQAKNIAAAQKAITLAYEEYTKDLFVIPGHLRHLKIL
jgi:hypothetical protein